MNRNKIDVDFQKVFKIVPCQLKFIVVDNGKRPSKSVKVNILVT